MANNKVMQLQIWANEERGRGLMLAKALGVQPPSVSDWITGKKAVPLERCTAIERATDGAVTRQDLRPDDWAQIWPELADAQVPIASPVADVVADVADVVEKIMKKAVHADDLIVSGSVAATLARREELTEERRQAERLKRLEAAAGSHPQVDPAAMPATAPHKSEAFSTPPALSAASLPATGLVAASEHTFDPCELAPSASLRLEDSQVE